MPSKIRFPTASLPKQINPDFGYIPDPSLNSHFILSEMSGVDGDIQAVSQSGGSFQSKLVDTLTGLSNANKERKGEIDSLRHDHEELKKNHESFVTSAERENDLRKNEIKSLEEKMQKENQVMMFLIFLAIRLCIYCLA